MLAPPLKIKSTLKSFVSYAASHIDDELPIPIGDSVLIQLAVILRLGLSIFKGLLMPEWKKPWKLLKNFARTWKLFSAETYLCCEAYWYFLYLTSLLSDFLLSVGHHFGIIVGESSHQKLSESTKSSQKVDLQGCKTFFFFFLPNFLWESCIIVVKVIYCQQSCCYGFNRTLVIMASWSCDQNVHFNKLLFIFGSLPK